MSTREERSKAMFGAKDALDVFGVVLGYTVEPPQLFTVTDVHKEFFDRTAINTSSIRRNLDKLEILGAIQRVPGENSQISYQRTEVFLWDLVADMIDKEVDISLEG
jgi:hypothetical protein